MFLYFSSIQQTSCVCVHSIVTTVVWATIFVLQKRRKASNYINCTAMHLGQMRLSWALNSFAYAMQTFSSSFSRFPVQFPSVSSDSPPLTALYSFLYLNRKQVIIYYKRVFVRVCIASPLNMWILFRPYAFQSFPVLSSVETLFFSSVFFSNTASDIMCRVVRQCFIFSTVYTMNKI